MPQMPQMFDAKSILDTLLRGGAGAEPPAPQGSLGGLGDLLRRLQPDDPTRQASSGASPGENSSPARGDVRPATTSADAATLRKEEGAGPQGAGSVEDMLRHVLGQDGGTLQDVLGKLQQQGGRLGDILGQVLGQATSGVREGAARIDDATGASRYARDATTKVTGSSPEEILAQLRKLAADNPGATGAALGGIGAVILGTRVGRSLAGTAVKLGSLALVGGLAYKAVQNYQQSRPALSGGKPQPEALMAAPEGSGFEPGAVTHERASLLIRAMIAAAAADGRIDEKERQTILAGLKQAGLEADAQQFLTRQLEQPATPDELAAAVTSPTEAVQVYTAARVAVDPDIEEEHEFLGALADRLGIDEDLAAQIDAAARGAGT
jgi:uncharacterized membrane protein YebE (DUF533 family)